MEIMKTKRRKNEISMQEKPHCPSQNDKPFDMMKKSSYKLGEFRVIFHPPFTTTLHPTT